MAKNSVVAINQEKTLSKEASPPFQVNVEDVVNPHKFQIFLDYGESPGPWVTLGFNNTAYSIGYVPDSD